MKINDAVSLHDVGRRGRLDLTFAARRGQTIVRDCYCEVPFKITRLHNSLSLRMAHLIVMQCTAGLFGGDTVECAIHVESGARLVITQQSATKVHPSRADPAIQKTRIRVESEGELHVYFDPLIPFSGSRLHQTTSIDLAAGSRFYLWESFMAGRVGRGEVWQFDELCSETRLQLNGRIIHLDRFRLMPRLQSPADSWAMSHYRYFGVGLCFDERAVDAAVRLHEALPDAGVDTPAEGLTVVRALAFEGQEFHRHRELFTETIRHLSMGSDHSIPEFGTKFGN